MAGRTGANFPVAGFFLVFQRSLDVARSIVVVIVQSFFVYAFRTHEKITGLAMAEINIRWAAAFHLFLVKVSYVDCCDFVNVKCHRGGGRQRDSTHKIKYDGFYFHIAVLASPEFLYETSGCVYISFDVTLKCLYNSPTNHWRDIFWSGVTAS